MFAQAFACFSNALALEPRHGDTLMAAGALYKSCGLLPEALQSLEAALEARPKDAAFKQALAVVLTDLGELLDRTTSGLSMMSSFEPPHTAIPAAIIATGIAWSPMQYQELVMQAFALLLVVQAPIICLLGHAG